MGRPEWISASDLARVRDQHPDLEQDTLLDHEQGDTDEHE
jgi:hypothetical protein